MASISVSISSDNAVVKEITEKTTGSEMTDLISALTTIKSQTNEYLTELVEAGKAQSQAGNDNGANAVDNSTRPTVLVVPEKKAKV